MSFWLDGRWAAIIGCKKLKQLYVHWFGCNGKFNNISIFMNKKKWWLSKDFTSDVVLVFVILNEIVQQIYKVYSKEWESRCRTWYFSTLLHGKGKTHNLNTLISVTWLLSYALAYPNSCGVEIEGLTCQNSFFLCSSYLASNPAFGSCYFLRV